MKTLIRLMILFLFAMISGLYGQQSVIHTLHNLSRSGPGTVKSSTVEDACRFCHVQHTATPEVPLWGHKLSDATYDTYSSDTLDCFVPQPNGTSKLCLSCHDGTIALGELSNRRLDVGPIPSTSAAFIGTDLSGSHPVSMTVTRQTIDANNETSTHLASLDRMKMDLEGVTLDHEDRVQCTTCHDPHSDRYFTGSGIHFWRKPTFSEVCLVCHLP